MVFVVLAVLAAAPLAAQDGPPCPPFEGYGPPHEPGDYSAMTAEPLPDALRRIADCEVALIPAKIALHRARYSDDPTLRPALRRIVDAWRVQASDVTGHAYVALAVLGERPEYFMAEVERALADSLYSVANHAAQGGAAVYPDSARYGRLRVLEEEYGANLSLSSYWDVVKGLAETHPDYIPYDEGGYRFEIVLWRPLQEAVDGALASLFDLGFRANGVGGGLIAFSSVGGDDSLIYENVLSTIAFRLLGASDPEGVRAAVLNSPVWAEKAADLGGPSPFLDTYRRMVLSAALPGESLTSDTFDPPADMSLLQVPADRRDDP